MKSYDFCLAWNWGYDKDFVALLERACLEQGLSMLQVTPDNLASIRASLLGNLLRFRAFFDRASDADESFMPIVEWAGQWARYRLNPFRLARRAWDKAAMHEKLSAGGLCLPACLVLPSYREQRDLPVRDLTCLGERFAIKPVHGGGGQGVHTEACSWDQVLRARQSYPGDQYMLQGHVDPVWLSQREAWFRVIYCGGEAHPCWWNTRTHIYTPVTAGESQTFQLSALWEIPAQIARLCGLELFSTEIALTADGCLTIVDYINDPVDLRLQSRALDGIPDWIVGSIARKIARLVAFSIK